MNEYGTGDTLDMSEIRTVRENGLSFSIFEKKVPDSRKNPRSKKMSI